MVKTKVKKGFICDNCGYGWIPRVIKPKKCPKCGTRAWDRSD